MRLFIKNLTSGLSVLCILLVVSCGQADAPKGPAMWRLETDSATVYFLGSFHILPPGLEWRDDRIDQAMKTADAIYFEVDEREVNDRYIAQQMLSLALLPEGQSLKSLLSPDVYDQLVEAAPRYGMDARMLDRMKPWFVSITLSVLDMTLKGNSPDSGVDSVLAAEADKSGKAIRAFETFDQQISILDSLSSEDPDTLIVEVLRYLGEGNTLLEDTRQAWLTGDEDTIARLFLDDMAQYRDAYETFLVNRNRNWIPEIEAQLDAGGTYFDVAGAAHMVGPDSVIQMLKDKGYVVERY
ncbi:MAG: TraB/GumN family protein [Proteobacteria bacterium]|nr:TraB/GumN family protein [Pseudomonadota bacterium]